MPSRKSPTAGRKAAPAKRQSDPFARMDRWTSEQVALFKERARASQMPRPGVGVAAAAAAAPPPLIVAEGDSWFDYLPGTDVIDCLRVNHGYLIDNHAKAGDTLENMIYGTGIDNRFRRVPPTIDGVLRQLGRLQPQVFLFSGGGNDVAGEEFESYLNHKNSGLPVLREQYVAEMMTVFRKYFEDLIAKVAAVSPATHIVVHGYGRTVPTGAGVDILFINFAGPWLRPALARKGVFDPTEQRNAVFTLIDRYNELLAELDRNHALFHHVDLRALIDPDRDWANELHLRNSAYARVAQRLDGLIRAL